MIPVQIGEVLSASGGKLLSGRKTDLIKSFSIDSRKTAAGDFFIAVKGKNFDGHDFIEEAVSRGASGVMCERSPVRGLLPEDISLIRVGSSVKAMLDVASFIGKKAKASFIGVTGTNGKTTTKCLLHHILSSKYRSLKSRKSFNNAVGVALTMFELDGSEDFAVFELGTNHPGELAQLASRVRPDVAIITNIGDAHLEFFGSKRGVLREKVSSLKYLRKDGIALLNADDPLLKGVSAGPAAVKYFGKDARSDFLISDVARKDGGWLFALNGEELFIPLPGVHNVHNAAAASSAAMLLGIGIAEIREAIGTAKLPDMRLEKISAAGVTFLNDSYSANPGSFECALEALRDSSARGRNGVVAGDMLELGPRSVFFHRKLGESIAARKIDFLVTVGELSAFTAFGAVSSGMDPGRVHKAKDRKEAVEVIKKIMEKDDVILVKGSRGMKLEEIVECFTTSCIP